MFPFVPLVPLTPRLAEYDGSFESADGGEEVASFVGQGRGIIVIIIIIIIIIIHVIRSFGHYYDYNSLVIIIHYYYSLANSLVHLVMTTIHYD